MYLLFKIRWFSSDRHVGLLAGRVQQNMALPSSHRGYNRCCILIWPHLSHYLRCKHFPTELVNLTLESISKSAWNTSDQFATRGGLYLVGHKNGPKNMVVEFVHIYIYIYINEYIAQTKNLAESPIESPNRITMFHGPKNHYQLISHLSGEHLSMYRQ